jgi:hypothetical protein
MNTLQALTRQIDRTWRATRQTQQAQSQSGQPQSTVERSCGKVLTKTGKQAPRLQTPVSLLVAAVCLAGAMGQRFYNTPELDVGTIAPYTITAPADARVEDAKTTEAKRKAARIASYPVLAIDRPTNQKIVRNLERRLEQGSQLRDIAGAFPYAPTSILSTGVQDYLRDCPVWEWQTLQQVATDTARQSEDPLLVDTLRHGILTGVSRGILDPIRDSQRLYRKAEEQLIAYRRIASEREFAQMLEAIESARQNLAIARAALSSASMARSDSIYTSRLFALSDSTWQETRAGIQSTANRILAQGLPPGLPPEIQRQAVEIHLEASVPIQGRSLAVDLLMAVLEPNLTQDPDQTRQRAEQAAQEVEPTIVTVQKGEVIVEAGEEISREDFVLLDRFELTRRDLVNWVGLVGFGGLVCVSVGIYWAVERKFYPRSRRRDRVLLLLLSLSVPLTVVLRLPTTSLPAVGLLAGSFYGSPVGVTTVVLLSALLPVGAELEMGYLLAGTVGGLVGCMGASRLRSREELALLGVGVGLAQGLVYLIVNLILSAAAGPIWYVLLGSAAVQALVGVAWSIMAMGISPYLEHVFDLVTPIRLAELANPNRPLLKRLATQAPGTFQHTLFVSSLAEAAACELGCNVELVRSGTLYHDIGKMHDPMGFIENQMGGPNKHDTIDDPWKSAQIIKKHVSEGLVMARKHRLPKAIQSFIPEHQGTMLIAYFYHQALQQSKQGDPRPVREEDFRYDGPIPQSRETGIVMLADSCEAALRSLNDVTPDEALSMVNKILRARWQDNQLIDSGLKREEMPRIAEIFVQVWQQFNHKRIAYPKAVMSAK